MVLSVRRRSTARCCMPMARYDSPSSNSTAVNPMTASGAEQKLTFWIACFRFWPHSGHCAAGAVEPCETVTVRPLVQIRP